MLKEYIKPRKSPIIINAIVKMIGTVLEVVLPTILAHIVDTIIPTGRGTHQKLLERNGAYAQLYRAQFSWSYVLGEDYIRLAQEAHTNYRKDKEKVKRNSLHFELSLKISIFFILVIFTLSSAITIYMSNQYNKIIVQNMNNNMENVVKSIGSKVHWLLFWRC